MESWVVLFSNYLPHLSFANIWENSIEGVTFKGKFTDTLERQYQWLIFTETGSKNGKSEYLTLQKPWYII